MPAYLPASVAMSICLQRPEDSIRSRGARTTGGYELPGWVLGTKRRSPREQYLLLITEPYLQSLFLRCSPEHLFH